MGNQYFIDFSFSDFRSKEFYDSIEKLDIALKKYKIIENSYKKHTEQISKFKSKLYNSINMYKRLNPILKRIKSTKIFSYKEYNKEYNKEYKKKYNKEYNKESKKKYKKDNNKNHIGFNKYCRSIINL